MIELLLNELCEAAIAHDNAKQDLETIKDQVEVSKLECLRIKNKLLDYIKGPYNV